MICKVCGTNNEDYLEYCKKCSAPLHGSDNADNLSLIHISEPTRRS